MAQESHRAQCDAERRLGALTKQRLETLIRSGPVELRASPERRDKYGRLLVQLLVGGQDVGCLLIREGYAKPWRAKREGWYVKTAIFKHAGLEADCSLAGSVPR